MINYSIFHLGTKTQYEQDHSLWNVANAFSSWPTNHQHTRCWHDRPAGSGEPVADALVVLCPDRWLEPCFFLSLLFSSCWITVVGGGLLVDGYLMLHFVCCRCCFNGKNVRNAVEEFRKTEAIISLANHKTSDWSAHAEPLIIYPLFSHHEALSASIINQKDKWLNHHSPWWSLLSPVV